MVYLKSLLILYASFMLLWSLVLIYYLLGAIISQRQPPWLRTIIKNGAAAEMVIYGSVMMAPIFVFFITIMAFKQLFTRRKKQ